MFSQPLAYFITFRTYGSWLHGDERGSVDREHNQFGTPLQPPSESRREFEQELLRHAPVELGGEQRSVVAEAIEDVCRHRGWTLHAANVRSNHVHVVVTADSSPERAMGTFKSYATRRLRECGLATTDQRVWSRHGSTIYLFKHENLQAKILYVREGQ